MSINLVCKSVLFGVLTKQASLMEDWLDWNMPWTSTLYVLSKWESRTPLLLVAQLRRVIYVFLIDSKTSGFEIGVLSSFTSVKINLYWLAPMFWAYRLVEVKEATS